VDRLAGGGGHTPGVAGALLTVGSMALARSRSCRTTSALAHGWVKLNIGLALASLVIALPVLILLVSRYGLTGGPRRGCLINVGLHRALQSSCCIAGCCPVRRSVWVLVGRVAPARCRRGLRGHRPLPVPGRTPALAWEVHCGRTVLCAGPWWRRGSPSP